MESFVGSNVILQFVGDNLNVPHERLSFFVL